MERVKTAGLKADRDAVAKSRDEERRAAIVGESIFF